MFRFQNVVFWFYGLVICLLGCWVLCLHFEKKRLWEQYFQHDKTLIKAFNVLESVGEKQLAQLEKTSLDYPIPTNKLLRQRGETVRKLKKEFQNFQEKEFDKTPPPPKPFPINWFPIMKNVLTDSASVAQFFKIERRFADSLFFFTEKNPAPRRALEPFFSENRTAAATKIIGSRRDDQKAMLLKIVKLKRTTAACRAMSFFENQLEGDLYPKTDFLPVLDFKNICVRAGEEFRGEVAAACFFKNSRNLTYWIDGKKVPVKNGLGKFERVFETAGSQNIKTKIAITNPLTGQVETFNRDFSIEICQ